jgi:phosphoserine phosphatase
MWLKAGYTIADAGALHREFSIRRITHREWCAKTCSALRERGFSHTHLLEIIAGIEPVEDLVPTLKKLHSQGIQLFIVSGSVREIIASVLGETYKLFSEIRSNEILFDEQGIISQIRGHDFDFEGKDKFIRHVARDEVHCEPLQVLFVGNSLNDSWASRSGARTLLVNPSNVDYTDTATWNDCLREMKSLHEIEGFVFTEGST